MTPSDRILSALRGQKELEDQLAFGFTPQDSQRPYGVDLSEKGVRLRLEVEDFDRLGVVLVGIELEVEREATAGADEALNKQIDGLTKGFDYLYGDFRLIEQEKKDRQAILRTALSFNGTARYYEVVLRNGTEATLKHYTVDESRQRHASTANVSMDSFARLVDDLVELFGVEE